MTYGVTNSFASKEELEEVKLDVNVGFSKLTSLLDSQYSYSSQWNKKAFAVAYISFITIILFMFSTFMYNMWNTNRLNEALQSLIIENQAQSEKITELTGTINELNNTLIFMKEMEETEMTTEETIQSTVEEIKEEVTPNIEETNHYTYYDFDRIQYPSGLSAKQFDTITKILFKKLGKAENSMCTLGKALYDVEQTYGVNGLYILGIGALESGWGTSQLAINKNNLYGLYGKSFDNVYDCTMYMGKLLRTKYLDQGLISLKDIATKYCEGNETWPDAVTRCYARFVKVADDLYGDK